MFKVLGDLDAVSAPLLRDAVANEANGDVVIDLADAGRVDSSGLGVFVGCHKRLTTEGRRFVLRSPGERLRNVLTVTALDRIFAIELGTA